MFSAPILRTSPPPPPEAEAEADADADSDGALEAEADADALAPAEPLGETLGSGVAEGAGAYVQPGAAEVQAAATTRNAAMTDRERTLRIGSGDLITWARMTAVGCSGQMLPRRRGTSADQYQGTSTPPVPSSGLSRDHIATSLHLPQTGATDAPQDRKSTRPDEAKRRRSSLARHDDARPDHRHRHRAGRRSPLVIPAAARPCAGRIRDHLYRISLAGRCWPAIVLIETRRPPSGSLLVRWVASGPP